MAIEFLVAVASGLIVAVISEFLHRNQKPHDLPIFEVDLEDITIRRGSVVDQDSVEVTEEVRICRWTFRAQETPRPPPPDHRLALIAGALIFIAVLAILLLL